MPLDVLVPQDLQRDVLALQLAVDCHPVGFGTAAMPLLLASRGKELCLQRGVGHLNIDGVFYFMAAAALLLAALAASRSLTTTAPQHLERSFDILAPQAASLAHNPLEASDEPPSPVPG